MADPRPIWTPLAHVDDAPVAPADTVWLPDCTEQEAIDLLAVDLSLSGPVDAAADHAVLTEGLRDPTEAMDPWAYTNPIVVWGEGAVPIFVGDDPNPEDFSTPWRAVAGTGLAAARVGEGRLVYGLHDGWLRAGGDLGERLRRNVEAWLLEGAPEGTVVEHVAAELLTCGEVVDVRRRLADGLRAIVTGERLGWHMQHLDPESEWEWVAKRVQAAHGSPANRLLWGSGLTSIEVPLMSATIRLATTEDVRLANANSALEALAAGGLTPEARRLALATVAWATYGLPGPPSVPDGSFGDFHSRLEAAASEATPYGLLDPGLLSVDKGTRTRVIGPMLELAFASPVTVQVELAEGCDPVRAAGAIPVETVAALPEDEHLYGPQIFFSDEATTLLYRSPEQVGGTLEVSGRGLNRVSATGSVSARDDGLEGDHVAGDGVFTAACLQAVDVSDLTGGLPAVGDYAEPVLVDAALRGSIEVTDAGAGVSMTDAGFFLPVGATYSGIRSGHSLSSPSGCIACAMAWRLAGDAFDFLVVQTREDLGGAGYWRIHDGVLGISVTPGTHAGLIDGEPHHRLQGLIWSPSIRLAGLTHEFGHWLGLGPEDRDFPRAGAGWNSGDGMHLEWDNTTKGDLSGPVWDPVHGFPVSVGLRGEDGVVHEALVAGNPDDGFRLEAYDGSWPLWDDIFLYMLGLLDPADTEQQYWKILGMGLPDSCVFEEWRTFCEGTSVPVTVEDSIQYSVESLIDRFGPRVPAYGNAPTTYDWGALFISDRVHTEAEITYLTLAVREYTNRMNWSNDSPTLLATAPWPTVTRGLGSLRTDFRELVAERQG